MRLILAGILLLAGFFAISLPVKAQNNTETNLIDTPQKMQAVYIKAKAIVIGRLNMPLTKPVLVQMVDAQTLDRLSKDSEYAGNTIGAFVACPSKSISGSIYVLENQGKDEVLSTLLHEYTHAWQAENSPTQSPEIAEGFARWVEYKGLQYAELYILAERLLNVRDPWYGLGLHKWLELEDKIGISGCLQYARTRENFDF
jgi:hypothetical protein